jgi:ribosomal-protein-alanine N-acetyltransferase
VTPGFEALREEDLAEVAAIEARAGDVGWSRSQFQGELMNPRAVFFVRRMEGRAAGFVGYWNLAPEAQLTNLVVDLAFRRRGIGRELLGHALRDAKAQGCRTMTLEVRAHNEAALALYAQAGFQTVGRRARLYDRPADDAVLMETRL